MTQLFIFGASITYGVGGEHGGWADILKLSLHEEMYRKGGSGETTEVYIFAKPGATVEFIKRNFAEYVSQFGKPGRKIAIVSVGLNDARAKNEPDNFVSTPEEFQQKMRALLTGLHEQMDAVIAIGYPPVDERKTMPKPSPIQGTTSYFSNERIQRFNSIFSDICSDLSIPFLAIAVDPAEWQMKFLYEDGLHPNDAGHRYIFEAVRPLVQEHISERPA